MAVADEAGDGRRVPYRGPGLVGEVHPDQDVAGENGALDDLALPVLDLGDLLGGDHDLVDVVLHVQRGGAVLEVGLHPVLHAGVGVDHEPVAGLGAQRLAELLERVDGGLVDARPRLGLGGLAGGGVLGLAGRSARSRARPASPRAPRRSARPQWGRQRCRRRCRRGVVGGRVDRLAGDLLGLGGRFVVLLRHGYSVTFSSVLGCCLRLGAGQRVCAGGSSRTP